MLFSWPRPSLGLLRFAASLVVCSGARLNALSKFDGFDKVENRPIQVKWLDDLGEAMHGKDAPAKLKISM